MNVHKNARLSQHSRAEVVRRVEARIGTFIEHYNHARDRESLGNVTSADAYFGRAADILRQRARIERQTIEHRRLQHRKIAA